jgi:uncharacterized phage-associated protein
MLDLASERKLVLTQLLLYKLLYFSHGWYLSAYNKPLILHEFEAWRHGPVIKVLRDQLRDKEDSPIVMKIEKLDIYTGEYTVVEPRIDAKDCKFISSVFDSYYHYGAWKLSEMTHEPDSPWDKLWNSTEPVGRLALRIRNDEIKAHFDGLTQRFSIS